MFVSLNPSQSTYRNESMSSPKLDVHGIISPPDSSRKCNRGKYHNVGSYGGVIPSEISPIRKKIL